MPKLGIFAGTWNLGGEVTKCSTELESWARNAQLQSPQCNLYVFGFQEVVNIKTYESHFWYPSQAYLDLVEALSRGLGEGYTLISCHGLSQMFIVVFSDDVAKANIRNAVTHDIACGYFNIIGNKGATVVKLTFNDGEEIMIVNSHLAAHKHNIKARHEQHRRIMESLVSWSNPASPQSIIWVGDLNYRLDLDIAEVREVLASTAPRLHRLLKECQLQKAKVANEAFGAFNELPIKFKPTYKYDLGKAVYDTSPKQRIPAWTDRVLWSGFQSKFRDVKAKDYKAWDDYMCSDHRPVSATLSIGVHSEAWRDIGDNDSRRFARAATLESGPTLLLVRAGELLMVTLLGVAVFYATSGTVRT